MNQNTDIIQDQITQDTDNRVAINHALKVVAEAEQLGTSRPDVSKMGFALTQSVMHDVQRGQINMYAVEALSRLNQTLAQDINPLWLSFPPPENTENGDFSILKTVLGKISKWFSVGNLLRGIQVYSSMGYGKSTFFFWLACAAAHLWLPVVIFTKKKDGFFEKILRLFPGRTLILRPSDSYYNAFHSVTGNPLDLGYKPQYKQAAYGKYDSEIFSIHGLDRFQKRQKESGRIAPTIDWFIETIPSLMKDFPRDTLNKYHIPSQLTMYYKMKYGPVGKIMNCQRGLIWKEVFKNKLITIIDLSDFDDVDEIFITSCLLHDFRITLQENPEIESISGAKLLCIGDEWDSIISRKWNNTQSAHSSPIGSEIILHRGVQSAIGFGGHTPSDCIPQVAANSYYSLTGCLTHMRDIDAGARVGGVLDDEQKRAISYLGVGQAILKESGKDPNLVTWKPLPPLPDVSEDERQESNAKILNTLSPIIPVDYKEYITVFSTPERAEKPSTAETGNNIPIQRAIIKDIHENKFVGVRDRYDEFDCPGIEIHREEYGLIIKQMKRRQLITQVDIKINRQGRASHFYAPTEKGYNLIDNPKDQLTPSPGSSLTHAFKEVFLVNCLKNNFGISSKRNANKGNKTSDVDFEHNGNSVAFEIAHSTINTEPQQALKDLKEWDYVITIFDTRHLCEKAERLFREALDEIHLERITLVEWWHILCAKNIEDIYMSSELKYKP